MWPVREVDQGRAKKEGSGGRRQSRQGAKSPAQSLWWAGGGGGRRGRVAPEGDGREGPQGGQGEEEGLGVVPQRQHPPAGGLWAGVFPALVCQIKYRTPGDLFEDSPMAKTMLPARGPGFHLVGELDPMCLT